MYVSRRRVRLSFGVKRPISPRPFCLCKGILSITLVPVEANFSCTLGGVIQFRRARTMEEGLSVDILHYLVNVWPLNTVLEPKRSMYNIPSARTPLRILHPLRNIGNDHNRRRPRRFPLP